MNHDHYEDTYIQRALNDTKTIAVVGASANKARASNRVTQYLIEKGYDVFPVNPGQAGKKICGVTCYASLKDVPKPIHMVDIFRNAEAVYGVVEEALDLTPLPKFIWMQLDIRNDDATKLAEAKGVEVIMNRCPKIEYARLYG